MNRFLLTALLSALALPCAAAMSVSLPQDQSPQEQSPQAQSPRTNWGNWRGADGLAVARRGNPPTSWSETRNIKWKVSVGGLGSSSPIIWGDFVYLTTAVKTGITKDAPKPEARGKKRRRRRGPAAPTHELEFRIVALNRADGTVAWAKTLAKAVPHEGTHPTASHASNSPLTDGKNLFVSFGSRGLFCLDMSGKVKWSKQFGKMKTRNTFGEGSSPALYGKTLLVNWDHQGSSFLIALHKDTGKKLWRKARDEQSSWSSPLVVDVAGKPQVIINATGASRGYDLATGDEIWSVSGMTDYTVPTPIHEDGLVYLMSGYKGAILHVVKLDGAKGDLSESPNLVWSHKRNTSYTPTPLLYDGFLYFLRVNSGVLSCLDGKTGKVHYEGKRLRMRTVYSSPVGVAGHVYITSRDGVTKVLKLGAEYEEVSTNTLDDGFDATIAIVGDELYLRGQESIYCIAKPSKE